MKVYHWGFRSASIQAGCTRVAFDSKGVSEEIGDALAECLAEVPGFTLYAPSAVQGSKVRVPDNVLLGSGGGDKLINP